MQTRLSSAVHVSNKNKYEQLENDQKCITGIMSQKLPQVSSGQQGGYNQLVISDKGKVFCNGWLLLIQVKLEKLQRLKTICEKSG